MDNIIEKDKKIP